MKSTTTDLDADGPPPGYHICRLCGRKHFGGHYFIDLVRHNLVHRVITCTECSCQVGFANSYVDNILKLETVPPICLEEDA